MFLCKKCGRYTDQFEWPQDQLHNFTGEFCFHCFSEGQSTKFDLDDVPTETDEDEDEVDGDIQIEKPAEVDPEDDDSPDIQSDSDDDESTGQSNEEDSPHASQPISSDAVEDPGGSIARIRELLFG